MLIALGMRGLNTTREVSMRVMFEGQSVGEYRADLVVQNKIIVKVKCAEKILKVHEAQVYNYPRVSGMELGMLLNFGPTPTYRRLILPTRN